MAFTIKNPLSKTPLLNKCKLPYPGDEVMAGKHGGVMTKKMTAANIKAKEECIASNPEQKAAKEKRYEEEKITGAFENPKEAKKQIAKENGKN
jgi:hypothetical protein